MENSRVGHTFSVAAIVSSSMSTEPSSSAEGAEFAARRERLTGALAVRLFDEGLRPEGADDMVPEAFAAWTPPSPEEVARLLGGRFEVKTLAGRGGMGAVYDSRHRDLGRRVAVKIMPPALGDVPGFAARFRHEARLTAQLEHPGIVKVFDSGETADGHLWYAMEYVDGEDLASRLRRGPLEPAEAVSILSDVASALETAHGAGVLHRDLKPGNILLPAAGGGKLGDFGLALTLDAVAHRHTRLGSTVGTLEYSAPEQLNSSLPITPASDLYSLGVVAYECLTGELPRGIFDPPSVRNAAVDPAFDGVVLRALQSDPARRFATARDFREALQHAAQRRERQAIEQRRLRQRLVRRARLAAVLSLLVLAFGAAALYSWRASREASAQRLAAMQAEAETNEIVQFLLTDLQSRLERTGHLEAMEAALEQAVVHYRRRDERSGRTAETTLALAEVLEIKAQVIGNRGMTTEAEALHEEACALTRAALRAGGDLPRLHAAVFAAQLNCVQYLMTLGRHADALAEARRLLQDAENWLAAHPAEDSRRAVPVAHRAIAHALAYTGPFDEARAAYDTAFRLFQELAAARPGSRQFADDLASIDLALGSLAEAQKDYPEMMARFTAWHDHVARQSGPDDWNVSHSNFRLGLAHLKSGHPSEAIPWLENAVRIASLHAAAAPGERGRHQHLILCLRSLSQAFQESGDTLRAADCHERAERLAAEL